MYLYSVGMALSNLCTYRRMTEGPILFDPPPFFLEFPQISTYLIELLYCGLVKGRSSK